MHFHPLADLSEQDRLIVMACRRPEVAGLDADRIAARFGNWEHLRPQIDRVHAHHVPGLVLSAFERCGLFEKLPPQSRIAAQTHLLRHRRRSGLLLIELERLGEAFETAGIDAVALKGAGLSLSVYPTPVERFMSDLDLLVAPDQVDRAFDTLLACGYDNPWSESAVRGYLTYHYHLPLVHRNGQICELHWGLVKPGRPYRLDPSVVIAGAVPIPELPGSLRMPRPEHQILHTAIQQLQDGFAHLSRTVDLDRLVAAGGLDWDGLARAAQANRLGPALAYAMQVTRHLLGTECPAELVRTLAPGPLARTHLSLFDPVRSALDQRFVGHRSACTLLRLWLTQGHSYRAAALADLVRDREDHEPLRKPWALQDSQPHTSRRRRLLELAKLAALQGWTYLRALAGLPTRRGRAQMRFWSSQLSSSERL